MGSIILSVSLELLRLLNNNKLSSEDKDYVSYQYIGVKRRLRYYV